MRKLLMAAVVGGVATSVAAVALASGSWPSVTVTPTVTPNKAGTPAHPQGVVVKTVFHWATLGSANQPIVTKFFVLFPKGSQYNGASYPTCSVGVLNSQGPSGCPPKSIMGSGTGNAYADTVITHPKITVVNGGANTIWFYTVLNNPARVQQPVAGHLTKMTGKWAYSLTSSVPQDLQIVAGVPIELTSLTVTAGSGKWLATTSCGPGGKWPYSVTTYYKNPNTNATGSSSYTATIPCH
jgi:hypothetical protein